MNITITGNLGSGKSSVCKVLKESGHEIISAGSIFRDIAAEKNMSVMELNEYAKTDKSIDELLDTRTTDLGGQKEDAVFDCRLGWHFIEDSFKVFLFVDNNEAARRVFDDNKRNAEKYDSISDAKNALIERSYLEQERFKQYYDINYYDTNNYDLIIDSTFATPEQIVKEVIRNYDLYKKSPFKNKTEISISSLLPTQSFRDFNLATFNEYRNNELNYPDLCACDMCGDTPVVARKDGLNFITDGHGHHRVFSAASTGKIFCKIGVISTDEESTRILSVPDRNKMYDFEDLGQSRVNYDWLNDKTKSFDYLLNLTDISYDIVSFKYFLNEAKLKYDQGMKAKTDMAHDSSKAGSLEYIYKDNVRGSKKLLRNAINCVSPIRSEQINEITAMFPDYFAHQKELLSEKELLNMIKD